MPAAAVLAFYHCIVMTWCNPHRALRWPWGFRHDRGPGGRVEASTTRVYWKGEGMVCGGQSECAVCLGEFRDGEAVRLLPKCTHYFHVPCIDMWLRSHSNCPMCRTETATPNHRPVPVVVEATNMAG